MAMQMQMQMPLPSFPLSTPAASIVTKSPNLKSYSFYSSISTAGAAARKKHLQNSSMACKATSSITDFDLYDLLGIDSSSDQSQIKLAYRSLQKRCHPDIAGSPGHDMAIILNQAYSVLSDPNSRMAYDKEHAKTAQLRGFTGKPMYSVWYGSEAEHRAVFVDEVKCVGCLKCALFAENTFAIESAYGRARVVAQWADPEYKIQAAIEACPVDCISIVERSNLAALEFLMSKQPRGCVRMSTGNTVGERVSNIFVDVIKFQTKFQESMGKSSTNSEDKDFQREARVSAIQAIRSISNWLYWQSPNAGTSVSHQPLTRIGQKSTNSNINKLRDAAEARRKARESTRTISQIPSSYISNEEYWNPTTQALPASPKNDSNYSSTSEPSQTEDRQQRKPRDHSVRQNKKMDTKIWIIPTGTATLAAFLVRLQVGEGFVGGVKEHMGGSLALGIVNSPWMQVSLAGITWYIIGMLMIQLIEAMRNK